VPTLAERGVVSFTFDGDTVMSTLPEEPVIPVYGAPIEGTFGDDRLDGTAEADVIRGNFGIDTIRPGLGEDRIDFYDRDSFVIGTPEELEGDVLGEGLFNVVLLFEGARFGADDVRLVEDFRPSEDIEGRLTIDLDGDGTADGGLGLRVFHFDESVLTATTARGTFVTTLSELPSSDEGIPVYPDVYDASRTTRASLRGDGPSDFAVRLSAASTAEAGVALGYYTYDRQGRIGEAELLTTDVAAEGDVAFLLDEIGDRQNIGFFTVDMEDPAALDGADEIAFVNQLGEAASREDRSYVFLEADGALVDGVPSYSASPLLNHTLAQRGAFGMSELPDLTVAMETGQFGADGDFDDVVLSVERIATDPI
jgi:hypothetical protein